METLVAPLINVVGLVALMAFYLRKPLGEYVRTRHQTVRQGLEDSRRSLVEAKQKFEDLSARLKGVDAEVSSLTGQAHQDAERSSATILSAARSLSSAIISDAGAAAGAARTEFLLFLRRELAGLAVSRAEARLRDRLTGEDHARIRREFSTLVEKNQ